MDLLAMRYANPLLIMDQFIKTHQFHEFTIEIITTIAKEKVRNARWEYYLAKVDNMTFEEYERRCEQPKQNGMTHKQIGNVINDSKKMLEGFVP